MRPEQIDTLNSLEEQLVDLFSAECKPAEWRKATAGSARENALREKKVALATMQLVGRIQNSLRYLRTGDGRGETPDPDRGEREEAQQVLKRVPAGLRKEAQALLKKHGKPH